MSREQIQTWFNEFFEFSTKDRSTVTSVSCKLFGEHVFNKQQERILELEQELTKSTDQNDLVLDEFIRVKCLTDNTEIHQLCERAHIRMRQRVSVIDRNYKLQKRIAELEKEIDMLVKVCKKVARKESRVDNYNENIELLDSTVDELNHVREHGNSYPATCKVCGQ